MFFIALFLGVLGIHDFIMKRIKRGVTHLMVTIVAIIGVSISTFFSVIISLIGGSDNRNIPILQTISTICGVILVFSLVWAIYDAVMILVKKEA